MRSVAALAVALLALGCSGEDARDKSSATAAAPRDSAATSISAQNLRPDWEANRVLPERKGAGPFDAGREPAPTRPAAPAAAVPAAPTVQPAPFAYVGKVTRGDIGYAVLAREERVFVVRPGDTVERYRVQSISEKEVVILSIDSGATRSLAFTAGAASSLLSAAAAGIGSIDDVSLRVSAPTQVAVGEQFTLTVSLDSGMSVALETGRVEVRFDPKVLEIPGQSASSGAARLEIFGAYAGHPAPATIQFRAVAATPTATEIRVVPTSISDSDGRDVGVNPPQAHRLTIVRAAEAPAKRE